MSLSKHFYSLDEVQAALSYCSTHHKTTESLFWCHELIQSGCSSEAISILFESWLWHVGPFRLAWLIDAWNTLGSDEVQDTSILLSAYQLSSLPQHDHSLSTILLLRLVQRDTIPDRITRKTPAVLPSDDEKECYFIRSLFQGKARSAWWISSYLPIPRVWEVLSWYIQHILLNPHYSTCLGALQTYEKLLGYRSEEYDIIVRCMAILMCCLSPAQQHRSFQPLPLPSSSIPDTLAQWNSTLRLRRGRVYSIPTACLYGNTIRGHYKWSQHNKIQLYHIEKYWVGCPYWEEVVSKYASICEGTIQWNSEDDRERLYDEVFSDGIPDEWDHLEKKKSHGEGVLGPTESVTLKKYVTRFLSQSSRLAWHAFPTLLPFLSTLPFTDSFPVSILQPYQNLPSVLDEHTMVLLRPVRTIKRIGSSAPLLCVTKS